MAKGKHTFHGSPHKHVVKFAVSCDLFDVTNVTSVYSSLKMANIPASSFVCVMEIHPTWRSYLALQLRNSLVFRARFCYWLIAMLEKVEAQQLDKMRLCDHCSMEFESSLKPGAVKHARIGVKLGSLDDTMHNLEPEIKWSIRILPQVFQHLQLEGVFSWLSTLGGAHSALGDYFSKHAEIAWSLSVRQLFIALRIGDPVLAAHCKLFMSISLMQRGHLSRASKIIRSVYTVIENDQRLQEKRLVNCCKAAWIRLRYIRQQRKTMENGISSQSVEKCPVRIVRGRDSGLVYMIRNTVEPRMKETED